MKSMMSVKFVPSHLACKETTKRFVESTDKFSMTGKWGIKKEMLGGTSSNCWGATITSERQVKCTMRVEVEITVVYWTKNPEYRELTWYESRVEKKEVQDKNIEIEYTDKYWIDEDDFFIMDYYVPEWVEYDCNNPDHKVLSGEMV